MSRIAAYCKSSVFRILITYVRLVGLSLSYIGIIAQNVFCIYRTNMRLMRATYSEYFQEKLDHVPGHKLTLNPVLASNMKQELHCA